jgi:hypothetical protein
MFRSALFFCIMLISMRFNYRRWPLALCLLGLANAGTSGEPASAEFSADIVNRDASGRVVGPAAKLYVANRKVRLETSEAAAGFFLIDGELGTTLFVQPAQHLFMDAKQSTRLTQLFVPVDPNDPCPQWQAAAKNAGAADAGGVWRCERVHSATGDQDGSIEYRLVLPNEPLDSRWIDAGLRFPMKLKSGDGMTLALEHIRVEAQPASLFALPPEYRKSDPQALIERIKRSDVWVGQ